MPIAHDPERDITPKFLETVASWTAESQELFVVTRYPGSAGAKDYAFVHNLDEFLRLINVCPLGTDIVVLREAKLPIRDIVTDEFIAKATSAVPVELEYLIVGILPERTGDPRLPGRSGNAHETLIEDLRDYYGNPVALGICPAFWEADNGNMISASKGGIDGPR